MKKTVPILFALALASAGLLFVWPTPYVIAEQNGQFMRVNRLTGVVEYASATGWINPYAPTAGVGKPQDITRQVKLETAARIDGPVIESVLRNQSGRDLRWVRVDFSVLDGDGIVTDHGTAQVDSARSGDAVKVSMAPDRGIWPNDGKVRVDKITENAPPGVIL
jgi:hypothetical protein